jgi:glutamate synthase domain-containing protein 3
MSPRSGSELVSILRIIGREEWQPLRQHIFRHMGGTRSDRAREVLDKCSDTNLLFWKVPPRAKLAAAPARPASKATKNPRNSIPSHVL